MGVLVVQLIYVPYLSQYLPRLLVRMGIGLFLALCTSTSLTLLSIWLDNGELFPYGLIVVPQVLYGCAYFFSYVSTIEFIIAQSPLQMQGLLIGFWMCQYYYHYGFYVVSMALKSYTWQYYMAKTILIFLSCLCFLVAARKYKYRERNEVTDINEHLVIAEYTERQILTRDRIFSVA